VADLLQSGPTGVIYAGWFLSEFVGNDKHGEPIPWAHLDIAGPAFNDKRRGATPPSRARASESAPLWASPSRRSDHPGYS